MKIRFLARLLSILAILSLLLAPMAAPSVAGTMGDAPTMAMENMAGMGDGMPCCPPQKQPQPPDCQQSCPLATVCLAKCLPNLPAAADASQALFVAIALIPAWDDAARDLLSDPPPSRPPRT